MPYFSFEIDIEKRFLNRCFNPILNIIKQYNGEGIRTFAISREYLTITFIIHPNNPNYYPNSVNDVFDVLVNRYPYNDYTLRYNFITLRRHVCQSSNQLFTNAMQRAEEEEKVDM